MIPPPTDPELMGSMGDFDESQITDIGDALEGKVEKMLNKIPPIWEDAEKHGKANLAYDPSKCEDIYDPDKENFCHCC